MSAVPASPVNRQSLLGRARGLGSAHSGVHHWWTQRVTAVALVPLCLWLVSRIVAHAGADHQSMVQWMAHPFTAVLLILVVVASAHHAQLGLRVVIEDYIHHGAYKLAAILAVQGVAIVLALTAIVSVLKIAVGAV